MSKISVIFLVIILVLVGVAGYVMLDSKVDPTAKPIVTPSQTKNPSSTPIVSGWKTYTNTRYGFEFSYPKNHTVFSGISERESKLTPATTTSSRVTIAEKDDAHFMFGTEIVSLSVSQVSTNLSSRDWVNANAEKYSNKDEIKSIKEITFSGRFATELRGGGNLGSVYRLIAINTDNGLLVVTQNSESILLDKILSSFRFVD